MKIDHASMMVSDVDAARAFYVGVLELEELPRPSTFTFPGMWLKVGGQQVHLFGEAEPGRARETHPGYRPNELAKGYANHFAIDVDDLAQTLQDLQGRGAEIVGGPRRRGDGVLQAYIADPDGNVIELMQTGVPITGDEPEIGTPSTQGGSA